MVLSRFVRIQLIIFSVVTVVALTVMGVYYMRIPALMGIGRYTVTVELSTSGGLYETANVAYRGATVGTITEVSPTRGGVTAKLNLDSSVRVPVDIVAEVHSRSAIGEQYVDLVPKSLSGPYLEEGSVIPVERTTVPQDIAPMLDSADRNLAAIPQDRLTTLIDESYRAFNGTGPQIQHLLDASNLLVRAANDEVGPTTTLIDQLPGFLDAQAQSADNIYAWAHDLNDLTRQLHERDQSIQTILHTGRDAADEATRLFQELRPTLPILLDNLTSLGQIGVTYNPSLETVLVVAPQLMAYMTTAGAVNKDGTNEPFLSFNLGNLNSPEPCTTGYLPASERRGATHTDAPPRTRDAMYCAIPADAPIDVRGARNLPCMDNPGKRAPTVEICKSDEEYQPKGTNPWIGDPLPIVDNPLADAAGGAVGAPPPGPPGPVNAPASHQPDATSGAPPVQTARYDQRTGRYQGSDGVTYALSSLADRRGESMTWQAMLTGPAR